MTDSHILFYCFCQHCLGVSHYCIVHPKTSLIVTKFLLFKQSKYLVKISCRNMSLSFRPNLSGIQTKLNSMTQCSKLLFCKLGLNECKLTWPGEVTFLEDKMGKFYLNWSNEARSGLEINVQLAADEDTVQRPGLSDLSSAWRMAVTNCLATSPSRTQKTKQFIISNLLSQHFANVT